MACLAELGHTVIGLDTNPLKTAMLGQGLAPVSEPGLADLLTKAWQNGRILVSDDPMDAVLKSDISLVCVGTPSCPDGTLDDTQLLHVIHELAIACQQKKDRHLIVVRSTALPTTHDKLLAHIDQIGLKPGQDVGYVVHPEFLREGNGIEDFFDPPFILFGGASDTDQRWLDGLYPGLTAPVDYVNRSIATIVKYAGNLFHALKVTFANEIGQWCQAQGEDGRSVMSFVSSDYKLNLSSAYLRPGLPFGGSCLPKDVAAVLQNARQQGLSLPLIAGVAHSNHNQIEVVADRLIGLPYTHILMVGVAFKAGTDDLRESPLVALAQRLLDAGKSLLIYDPGIACDRFTGANLAYMHRHLPDLPTLLVEDWANALSEADALLVGHPLSIEMWTKVQASQVAIIDLVGIAPIAELRQPYYGLYW